MNTDNHLNKEFFKEKVRLAIHYYILELLFVPYNQANRLPKNVKQKRANGQIVTAKQKKFW
jgi:hypothetical protein